MKRENNLETIIRAGISSEDARALRRISITLHRWHELECGADNGYASFVVTRGRKEKREFIYDENGSPFIESHPHSGAKTSYEPIADRERGAKDRLAKIMTRYPELGTYIQTDPRGCALYIIPRDKIRDGLTVENCYSSIGIAVY
jgi:hypothetical protein